MVKCVRRQRSGQGRCTRQGGTEHEVAENAVGAPAPVPAAIAPAETPAEEAEPTEEPVEEAAPAEGAKECPNCHEPVTGKFCGNCGTKVEE